MEFLDWVGRRSLVALAYIYTQRPAAGQQQEKKKTIPPGQQMYIFVSLAVSSLAISIINEYVFILPDRYLSMGCKCSCRRWPNGARPFADNYTRNINSFRLLFSLSLSLRLKESVSPARLSPSITRLLLLCITEMTSQ